MSLRVEVITSSTQAGGGGRGMSCSAAWAGEGRVALVWGVAGCGRGEQAQEWSRGPTPGHLLSLFLLLGRGPVAQAVGCRGRGRVPGAKVRPLSGWGTARSRQRAGVDRVPVRLAETDENCPAGVSRGARRQDSSPELSEYASGQAQTCWRQWVGSQF